MTEKSPVRQQIIDYLNNHPGERIGIKQMARELEHSQQTISRHMTELSEQSIVRWCVQSSRRYYYIPTEAELAALNGEAPIPNWKKARDYRYPIQIQRRIAEIAEHRAKFQSVYR